MTDSGGGLWLWNGAEVGPASPVTVVVPEETSFGDVIVQLRRQRAARWRRRWSKVVVVVAFFVVVDIPTWDGSTVSSVVVPEVTPQEASNYVVMEESLNPVMASDIPRWWATLRPKPARRLHRHLSHVHRRPPTIPYVEEQHYMGGCPPSVCR